MKEKRDAVIVAMGRTAIGDFGGSLVGLKAHALAAQVIRHILETSGVDPAQFDDVRGGPQKSDSRVRW